MLPEISGSVLSLDIYAFAKAKVFQDCIAYFKALQKQKHFFKRSRASLFSLTPSDFARVYVFPRALVHYLLENLAEVERIVIAARACNRVDIALAVSDNFNGAHNAKLR